MGLFEGPEDVEDKLWNPNAQILRVEVQIARVEAQIARVEAAIQAAEDKANVASDTQERDYWRKEEVQLREKERQLREEEILLLKEKIDLRKLALLRGTAGAPSRLGIPPFLWSSCLQRFLAELSRALLLRSRDAIGALLLARMLPCHGAVHLLRESLCCQECDKHHSLACCTICAV